MFMALLPSDPEASGQMSLIGLFDVAQLDHTVVITPLRNPSELGSDDLLECDPGGAIRLLESHQARNVIIDCHNIDRCCSSGFGLFIKLWKRSQANLGRMAFCNVSPHMQQIIGILSLDAMWPVVGSLSEAVVFIEGSSPTATKDGVASAQGAKQDATAAAGDAMPARFRSAAP